MSEKPIIFSTENVRAILEGRKTVTRRVIKIENPKHYRDTTLLTDGTYRFNGYGTADFKFHMPSYQKGDLLWVKETYTVNSGAFDKKPRDINPEIDSIWYGADSKDMGWTCWKSSRFMPKKLARIWLKVLNVRAEQLQEITIEDIKKEGILSCIKRGCPTFVIAFAELWDSLNAKRGYPYESNPWVFRYEFTRIER